MIYHLALADDWAAAADTGQYAMSTRGATIADVGYLHACGDLDQTQRVADFLYADRPRLVLLQIHEARLAEAGLTVRLEPGDPSRPDSEHFPHVYGGAIPLAAITAVPWPLPPETAQP